MTQRSSDNDRPEISPLEQALPRELVEVRYAIELGVDDGEFLVLAFVGEARVGFLEVETEWVAETNGWAPLIENVEVEEGWRRRGIASGMLAFLHRETGVRPEHNWSDISGDGEAWARAVAVSPPEIGV